ncbi:MarR family winged helix-turn-helix transcriptional regulator [Lactiplantibacillus mudanjiangensis]|uniref:Transcription regulator, MarR family [Lactobacillus plantarum ZJ316] n=1 Tax=Lactiplantibacillus mudanjiangensis TaxID=1296538 RepID=A0A660E0J7_9LACO|nr:MarR family winged helix-turn-helix transcriptional regulator [Lactiplantibacillus mudanjiangensis]VDG17817.1 Transcription regulator, MarR family [Lactobacillus plantarum ZJ316] [Lactiplantibacillus mudanjiangensis]VDG25480.1 Transcription regulator, MarR family [Lactobacillus plantarum ZJ316] [Lactiplantibacillus mudanjiangensis]VDG27932.1 Transcription regulator, MarR family [Lactobacillus plantarum ZJ316] [Lactiplantibacillus mudanjiangensis]VDG32485.1 Transcription regulator, MarR famil
MNNDEMIARQLLVLARKIKQRRNLHIQDLNLTTGQADALKYFADHPNQTIAMFKDYQEITHQTARVIVQHLVTLGVVTLAPNPNDGRAKLVVVTPLGLTKRAQLNEHGWRTSEELFAGFTAEEQQQFLALVRRANANLEGE